MKHKRKLIVFFVLFNISQIILSSDILSECSYKLTGFRFSPLNTEEYIMVNSNLKVYFDFSESPLNLYSSNAKITAVLIGPNNSDGVEIVGNLKEYLEIPGSYLSEKGEYVLSNICINDNGNKVFSYPTVVNIHVIDKILSTSVNTSLLSLEEMEALGIQTDGSNFSGYNVNISLGFESGTETMTIPVIIGDVDYEDVDGEEVHESASALVEGIKFPTVPDSWGAGVGKGTINPPPGSGGDGEREPIPAIVYFPGNVGFLHNFFKSVLIVINTTSQVANISVENLKAKAVLPRGEDGNYGTPENPGDDPLRIALTENGREYEKNIVNPGADGKLNTDDDTNILNSGDTGIAFFLIEGLREGTHKVQYDFSGNMEINGESSELTGSASGVILIKNPDLSVQFTHPDTVRANFPYTMTVTVKNTSEVPANKTYIQFDENTMVGGTFVDESDNPIGSFIKLPVLNGEGEEVLNPGETGVVKLRVLPYITGKIVASYISTDEGTVSLSLVHGVDDRDVDLSPDEIKLSWQYYQLPENYRIPLDLVLGDALSVATDPDLPEGVTRIKGRGLTEEQDEVQMLANHMMYSGLYYDLGESLEKIVFRNIIDFRTVSPGVEQLIRTSYSGKKLKNAEIEYFKQQLNSGNEVFFRNFLKAICDNENFRVLMLNNVENVQLKENETGLTANSESNLIPNTVFYQFDNKTLIILPKDSSQSFSVNFKGNSNNLNVFEGDFKNFNNFQFSENCNGKSFKLKINGHVDLLGDLDGNGSFESESSVETETIEFPQLNVIKVKQLDNQYFPDLKGLRFNYSDMVMVLFNRKLNIQSLENNSNYEIFKNSVISTAIQNGGRACILRLQKPVGHFFERSIKFENITDIYNEFTIEGEEHPIEMSENLKGYMVEGDVYNSDGELLKNHFVTIKSYFNRDEYREFYFKTDEFGHYLFEQALIGSSTKYKIRNGNKMRRPVVTGSYVGQRIVKDIYFTGTGNVKVTVLDEFGNTLDNVKLALRHHTELYHREALTDEFGQAEFKKVHMGSFTIHGVKQITGNQQVEKVWSGIVGGRLEKKDSTLEVTMYLESRRGNVKGKVLEDTFDDSGNNVFIPMANQAVVIYANFENAGGAYQCYNCKDEKVQVLDGQNYVPIAWQYTDINGEFQIENIPTGKIFFKVSTDNSFFTGTGSTTPYLLQNGETLDVSLVKKGQAESVIYGQVTYFDGTPAVAAKVSLGGGGSSSYNYTDEQGKFRFEHLFPGKYSVSARMGDQYNSSTDVDILTYNEEVEINLKFKPVASVEGIVYASDGVTPLPNQMVIIPPYKPNAVVYNPYTGAAIPLAQRFVFTDSNGKYVFNNLSLGEYKLVCVNGLRVANAMVSVSEPGTTVTANMKFLPAGKVTGKVVQGDGVTRAVSKVSLYCNLPSKNEENFGVITNTLLGEIITESDGSFEFPIVNAGKVKVMAKNFFASDNASYDSYLKTEGEEISVTLKLGEQHSGKIGGRVFLPDGISPAGSNVNVKITSTHFPEIKLKTNDLSEFTSPNILPSGTYSITASDETTGYIGKVIVNLTKNSSTFKDIRLKGYGKVEVQVKEINGNVVGEGIIKLTQNSPELGSIDKTVMFNNEQGIINFEKVLEGDFSVSVISKDGLAGRETGKITKNGQKFQLEITVEGYGNVIGSVFAPDGETLVEDAELTLYSLKTNKPVAYGTTLSDLENSGSFSFPYLPIDDYVLVAFDVINGRFGQTSFSIKENNEVKVANITLTGSGTVGGKVLNQDGSGAGNIQITLKAEVDVFGRNLEIENFSKMEITSTTAPDGSFKFEHVPVTEFSLYAKDDETGISGFKKGIIKENSETVNCNVNLTASGTVKVKVVDYFGNPKKYSLVTLFRNSFDFNGYVEKLVLNQTTDDLGNVVFKSIPAGYLRIIAKDTKGFVIGEKKSEIHTQDEVVEIVLQEKGRGKVFGTVYNADGSKVETGIISLFGNGYYKKGVIENGAYLFENIVFGDYTLKAESGIEKKEAKFNLNDDMLSGNVDIVLDPTGTVTGILVNSEGEPISDNSIKLYTQFGYFGSASTNIEGKFVFNLVPYGDFSLSTFHIPSGKHGVSAGNINKFNESVDVVITLESLGTVKGVVLGKEGTEFLAPRMTVTYLNNDTNYRKSVEVMGGGYFSIVNVPLGKYTLYYSDGYNFSEQDTGEIIEDNQIVDSHVFKIENYKKITGTLWNKDITPAYNCDIKLTGMQLRNVRTDQNGYFSIDYVKPGNYTLFVSDLEKIHNLTKMINTFDYSEDVINLNLYFSDNVKIRGYVFKNTERIVNAKVVDNSNGSITYTNYDGEYNLVTNRDEGGNYSVNVETSNRIPLYGTGSITVPENENIDGAVITMPNIEIEQTGVITGQFINLNTGQPLKNVRVEVTCRNRADYIYSSNDGTFQISNLPLSENIKLTINYGGYFGFTKVYENIVLTGDYSIGTVNIDTTFPVVQFENPLNNGEFQIPGTIKINYFDSETDIELAKVKIKVNNHDVTNMFTIGTDNATLQLNSMETPFNFGNNSLSIEVKNKQNLTTIKQLKFQIKEIPTSISGTLLNVQGQPVMVATNLTLTNLTTNEIFNITTDNSGKFKVENVKLGQFLIETDNETIKECVKFKGELTVTNAEISVEPRFYKYGKVTGTVFKPLKENETNFIPLDETDKALIEQNVQIYGQNHLINCETNVNGEFTLNYLPLGSYNIIAKEINGNHVSETKNIELFDNFREKTADFHYYPLGIVKGIVKNANGEKVTTGSVSYTVTLNEGSGNVYVGSEYIVSGYSEISDNEYSFVFENVLKGIVKLTGNSDNLQGETETSINFEGEEKIVEINLAEGKIVSGIVKLQDGTIPENIEVKLYNNYGNLVKTVNPDAAGNFSFTGYENIDYYVTASCNYNSKNYFIKSETFNFNLLNTIDLGELILVEDGLPEITITSTEPENQGYGGAYFKVNFNAKDDAKVAKINLNVSGAFQYENFNIYNTNDVSAYFNVLIPNNVDYENNNIAEITLEVFDNAGQSVTSNTINYQIIKDSTAPIISLKLTNGSVLENNHHFTLPPANFKIEYLDNESGINYNVNSSTIKINDINQTVYMNSSSFYFNNITSPIKKGENTYQVSITNNQGLTSTVTGSFFIDFGYSIEGTLYDSTGLPVGEGFKVILDEFISNVDLEVITDSNGHFIFESVNHSTNYKMYSESQTNYWYAEKEFVIDKQNQDNTIDLNYYKYGKLNIEIYRDLKAGEPIGTEELLNKLVSINLTGTENIGKTTSTGKLELNHLRLGNYEVIGEILSEISSKTEKTQLTLEEGNNFQTVKLHMPALNNISGNILNGVGEKFYDNVELSIIDINSGATLITKTFKYGSYNFYYIPKGNYKILANNKKQNLFNKNDILFNVEFHDETKSIDIILENSKSIKGKVLEADGVTPAANAKVSYICPSNTYLSAKTVYTDNLGEFILDNLYNNDFNLKISLADHKTYGFNNNFLTNDSFDLGTITLEQQTAPRVTLVLNETKLYQGDSLYFDIEIEADSVIKKYGFTTTGVIEQTNEFNYYGGKTTATLSSSLDIPYDATVGEFQLITYAIDENGERGDSESVKITIDKRFRNLEGTVVRADGVTIAVNATVKGYSEVAYYGEGGFEISKIPFETTTDEFGHFFVDAFLDASLGENFQSYYFKVFVVENEKIELYEEEGITIPENDIVYDKLVLVETTPEVPVISVNYNSEIPLIADSENIKPFIVNIESKHDVTNYGYEITGLFERSEEFQVDGGGQGGFKQTGDFSQRAQSGDAENRRVLTQRRKGAKGWSIDLINSAKLNPEFKIHNSKFNILPQARKAQSGDAENGRALTQRREDAKAAKDRNNFLSEHGTRNTEHTVPTSWNRAKIKSTSNTHPLEITPPRSGEELSENWENGVVTLKVYVTDEFGRKTYFNDISLSLAHFYSEISGTILFEDGNPAAKAEVEMVKYISNISENMDSNYKQLVFNTVSDEFGKFTFKNAYSPAESVKEKLITDWDEFDNEVLNIRVQKSDIYIFEINGKYISKNKNQFGSYSFTELPNSDTNIGNITMTNNLNPIVVIKTPYEGYPVSMTESIPLEVYIKGENTIQNVEADYFLQGENFCSTTVLADEGLSSNFNYGGKTGFRKFTGIVNCDLSDYGEQTRLLKIKVVDSSNFETEKYISIYPLWSIDAANNLKLSMSYPGNLSEIVNNSNILILPFQTVENGTLRELINNDFTETLGFGIVYNQFMEGGNYSEIFNLKANSSILGTKIKVKSSYDTCGEGCFADIYSTINLLKSNENVMFIKASEFDNNFDYSDKEVVITEGELALSINKTFKKLTLANNVTLKISGSTEITCAISFLALPQSSILNINDLGNPSVTITAPNIYIYGDYSGKGDNSNVIIFNGQLQEH